MDEISRNLDPVASTRPWHRVESPSVRTGRALVGTILRESRLEVPDRLEYNATLIACELLANGYLHGLATDPSEVQDGQAPPGVRLELGIRVRRMKPFRQFLRIEVHDASRELPIWPSADDRGENLLLGHGRGLPLAMGLATRYGAEPTEGGKVVWVEFDLRPRWLNRVAKALRVLKR